MEIRIPKKLEHFLSRSVAVITRSFVTQHDFFFFSIFLRKAQHLGPKRVLIESAFTGIIKLCEQTRGDKNKSQLATN